MGVRVGTLRAECSSVRKKALGCGGGKAEASRSNLQYVRVTKEGGLLVPQALYPILSSHQEPLVLPPLDDSSGCPWVCIRLRHEQIPNNSVMQQPPTLGMGLRPHFSKSHPP